MSTPRPVLVVDFGAQYAQLIARRAEARVYSVVPHTTPVAELLARTHGDHPVGPPCARPGAPQVDQPVRAGVPCSASATASRRWRPRSGKVTRTTAEYGNLLTVRAADSVLFAGLPEQQEVWMSHGDCVTVAPPAP